ncbi:MAG TPA: PRD domain-containing protein [Bacillota bacterium]|nr:PRD domain-containing protein [Bacillota bacterium]
MKIRKVLNNNAVIVLDDGEEKIAIGPGVGFNKSQDELVPRERIEKLFILRENEKLGQLFEQIPEEHILITEDIIRYAENYLNTKLSTHSRLGLTDHLSFAIERVTQGILLKNKLLQEIRILYKKEFEVGLWALKHIEEKLHVKLPIDEAAFIAIHIHTMKIQGGDVKETVRQTGVVRDMVDVIKNCLQVDIEEDEISYERLITHLRFALIRVEQGTTETMDKDMLQLIREKFPEAFACSQKLIETVGKKYNFHMSEEELGYITLHIERLRTS